MMTKGETLSCNECWRDKVLKNNPTSPRITNLLKFKFIINVFILLYITNALIVIEYKNYINNTLEAGVRCTKG